MLIIARKNMIIDRRGRIRIQLYLIKYWQIATTVCHRIWSIFKCNVQYVYERNWKWFCNRMWFYSHNLKQTFIALGSREGNESKPIHAAAGQTEDTLTVDLSRIKVISDLRIQQTTSMLHRMKEVFKPSTEKNSCLYKVNNIHYLTKHWIQQIDMKCLKVYKWCCLDSEKCLCPRTTPSLIIHWTKI